MAGYRARRGREWSENVLPPYHAPMTAAHHTKPLVSPLRVVIYTRISSDPMDKKYGVEDQEARCRTLAKGSGWHVVAVFEDNDESATKDKNPPEYRRMIAFLEAGLADVILVDVIDRFGSGRLMWKFAEFMRWREKQGIRLVSCEGDDTATADGQMILSFKVAMAEREWRKMKERLAKNQRKRAQDGVFNGGNLPYYITHPEAIPWVQQAATDVLNERSLHVIAKEWNQEGRVTEQGNQWVPRAIRRMLLSPSVIGKQELDGELYPVTGWPVVLDGEVWSAVVNILTAPDRRINEINQRKYMLSGLLTCGNTITNCHGNTQPCGNNLTSTGARRTTRRGAAVTDGPAFECSKHKTSRGGCGSNKISMDPLERYVREAVFFALDSSDFQKAVADQAPPVANAGPTGTDIAAWRAAITSLEDEKDDGLIDDGSYRRRRARLTAKIEAAEAELAAIRRANRRTSLPRGDELRTFWEGADDLQRREVVSAVIKRIDVYPHPRGVSSAPPRRSGEPLEDWRERFDRARMHTMDLRTDIHWHA